MSDETKIVDLTPDNIADYGVCGYKDVEKHDEFKNKIKWFEKYYTKGLKIKVIVAEKGGYQGMIEYIPGKYAHRPVNAERYIFIHCIFVGFKKEYKNKGFASSLIEACIEDAQMQNMLGVAVVTRKGSFMADKDIFLKRDFEIVDEAKPDFNLLALRFIKEAARPSFKPDMLTSLQNYKDGLTVLRSPQCPYTEKNVKAIIETAEKKFKIKASLIDLPDAVSVQNSPCAFGTFCIVYNGEIVSHHPISNTRFENIMNKANN